jgi:hypothetical protein
MKIICDTEKRLHTTSFVESMCAARKLYRLGIKNTDELFNNMIADIESKKKWIINYLNC